ncbi:ATP-binding protein [Polaromonas sp.]|uniref:ATP-binding protein n=1 Tax=Polaromonas sp. TaxID=1869339 RepID=UPI003BB7FBD7
MKNFFHRQRLAADMADKILQTAPGSASSSGLFLAAPRRTGKSTFLREDLRPQLEAQGALVLYADLWENRKADPGAVIIAAVRAALAQHEGVVARLARASGMDKVSVGGLSFSLDRIGLASGVSLSRALAALSDETGQTLVLVIDEAQHAITTESGADALFALKAARDELNSSRHHGLRVVATGSNQDKLAMLRNGKEQAFFGAPLVKFPALGKDYIAWFCQQVRLPAALSVEVVHALFVRASFRPEMLGAAADALRFDFELQPEDVPARFAQAVQEQIEASNAEQLRVIHSLTPLQSAVLRVLASKGAQYAPFETETILAYQRLLDTLAPHSTVKADVPNVQQALAALQEKALVWRASRGVYALEEASLQELMAQEGLLPGAGGATGQN